MRSNKLSTITFVITQQEMLYHSSRSFTILPIVTFEYPYHKPLKRIG
jgi:hypothetical protein